MFVSCEKPVVSLFTFVKMSFRFPSQFGLLPNFELSTSSISKTEHFAPEVLNWTVLQRNFNCYFGGEFIL